MKSVYPMSSPSSAVFADQGLSGKANQTQPPPPLGLVVPASKPGAKKPLRKNAWQVAPNLLVSFRYAWAGVSYAFATQRNFRIHTFTGVAVITAASLLHLEAIAVAVLALTSCLVMILELLNTALESVVDLTVGQSYHELAKIAKDCAAGAVLLAAIAAVIVGGCLLLPPLLSLMV
ncbi:diacylglycerol kinase [Synechocystis sp. PCC 6803]|uniref:Diacylglycerol kinase n=1 Tax=Synechocystis sp. (strain ATCC 27184 / PCC 6803 / Kazusa) TaxID=1111708 RepID=KDGL_SYNY3|nr:MULTISPECIES: diacylglycerol kinase [unclassified Synechocystis]Q55143.1 RecName: Full=Diacylglycerol kinase; Short=DAGK; AltName: Full=Diglyceride kinase; Short=DGK [Synechocystis sp. PCC 6803 substr. Kazusa]BAM54372.1 diacylglycerol kinase [Synechocystis sp. PCC 6803] [Bacillus subtilis BEST7613]AGF52571.1 diacylglycerol kinase [Synechocystis sp. PCC 6803]ALJ68494.1 diacylglycerol kinase [Synechocystis sp. PCC 6803]AVP90339.1 diacylglycerol kinase [Synechocystis sp. IPPAS B-1465]MBD26169